MRRKLDSWPRRRTFAGALLAGAVALGTAGTLVPGGMAAHAAAYARPGGQAEGSLVSATLLQRLSAGSVRAELANARLGPGAPALGDGQARYGVAAYRVTYRTVNATGRPVLASGLVAFPAGGPRMLRVVSYAHGTTATKADVPSTFGLGPAHAVEGRWSAELFASAGFGVTEPDYVGMGSGTGPIEYMVAKSEATASADLLTAARTLAARQGDTLDRGVLVTGFSQGGSAAVALGRYLARGNSGFTVRALAPVSGPYDLAGAEVPGLFNGQLAAAVAPYYVAYTLTSWKPLYRLYAAPDDAFAMPYAAEVTGLFDGSHTDQQVIAALPDNLHALLTPGFLDQLRHLRGRLLAAFEANNPCVAWAPRIPVRLYAAGGDTTVTQVNAWHCAQALRSSGAAVTVVQLGPVDHDTSDFLALPRILRWFLHLR
ncbi:MAG TPA: hypothetical protein VF070_06995 [Streptosporangiaceae bacterium]